MRLRLLSQRNGFIDKIMIDDTFWEDKRKFDILKIKDSTEFEHFIAFLFEKEFNQRYIAYPKGKDGGIDIENMDKDGKYTAISCKHYANSSFNNLKSTLKKDYKTYLENKEKSKTDNIVHPFFKDPRFILVTSLEFINPQDRSRIVEFFPLIKNHIDDIYDATCIENLVYKNYDSISKQYPYCFGAKLDQKDIDLIKSNLALYKSTVNALDATSSALKNLTITNKENKEVILNKENEKEINNQLAINNILQGDYEAVSLNYKKQELINKINQDFKKVQDVFDSQINTLGSIEKNIRIVDAFNTAYNAAVTEDEKIRIINTASSINMLTNINIGIIDDHTKYPELKYNKDEDIFKNMKYWKDYKNELNEFYKHDHKTFSGQHVPNQHFINLKIRSYIVEIQSLWLKLPNEQDWNNSEYDKDLINNIYNKLDNFHNKYFLDSQSMEKLKFYSKY